MIVAGVLSLHGAWAAVTTSQIAAAMKQNRWNALWTLHSIDEVKPFPGLQTH
jgi:hypothetical protein